VSEALWAARQDLALGVSGPGVAMAERAVLGCLLIDSGLASTVARAALRVSHFADPRHQRIFHAMLTRETKASRYDLVTIIADLDADGRLSDAGGVVYISSLLDNVPDVESVLEYARCVIDGALMRRVAASRSPR